MTAPIIVTGRELSQWLDCTPARIRQLAAEGTVVRLGRDKYDRDQSITNAIRRLRDQIARRCTADSANLSASANLKAARTALIEARVAREAAQLVSRDDLRMGWARIVRGTTAMVRGLPEKIARELPRLTATDHAMIRRLVEDGLEDAGLERGYDVGEAAGALDAADPA